MREQLAEGSYQPTPVSVEFAALVNSGDVAGAVALLDEHWMEVWFAVDPSDLKRILLTFPREAFEGFFYTAYLNQLVGAEVVTPAASREPNEDPELRLRELAVQGAQLRLAGRPEAAMALMPEAGELVRRVSGPLVDTSEGMMGAWLTQLGITALLAGDPVGARGHFKVAFNSRRPVRFPFVPRESAAKLALTNAAAGDVVSAAEWADRAEEMPRTASWVEQMIDDSISLTRYLCAIDALDLDRAEEMRQAAPSPVNHLEFWGIALTAQVRHLCLTGRATRARDLCDEVASMGLPMPDSDGWVAAILNDARLLCVPPAEAVPTLQPHTSYIELLARRTHLLATGQYGDLALQGGRATFGTPRDARTRLGLTLLRGQGLLLAGRVADGRALMLDALAETFAGGTLSVLRHLTTDALQAVADTELGGHALALVKEHGIPLIEVTAFLEAPLTPAEEKVMAMLSQGMSRGQIAGALFVSLHTVKSQLTSAYRKLGVSNRRDAVTRYEQLYG